MQASKVTTFFRRKDRRDVEVTLDLGNKHLVIQLGRDVPQRRAFVPTSKIELFNDDYDYKVVYYLGSWRMDGLRAFVDEQIWALDNDTERNERDSNSITPTNRPQYRHQTTRLFAFNE